MAERRMVKCSITQSDRFLSLPVAVQALYLHLCFNADDDGVVDCPLKIQRQIGCEIGGINTLIAKGYLIGFDSGIVVIVHWRVHNSIQKDRYKASDYREELSQLVVLENKCYAINPETKNPNSVSDTETKNPNPVSDTETKNPNPVSDTETENPNPVSDMETTSPKAVTGFTISVSNLYTQISIDKARQDKARSGQARAMPPPPPPALAPPHFFAMKRQGLSLYSGVA